MPMLTGDHPTMMTEILSTRSTADDCLREVRRVAVIINTITMVFSIGEGDQPHPLLTVSARCLRSTRWNHHGRHRLHRLVGNAVSSHRRTARISKRSTWCSRRGIKVATVCRNMLLPTKV